MKNFHNILFVSHGIEDETEALKQALSIAQANHAKLKAIIVCPELPKEMAEYEAKYRESLYGQLQNSIQAARGQIHIAEPAVDVPIDLESGSRPVIRVIRHVLKGEHDLLVKKVEPEDGGRGFTAIDMGLLRKCPCPVWLCRPIRRPRSEIRVAAAIDPQSMAPEGDCLAVRLLELARSVADTCSGELHVISCWDLASESTLQSVWLNVSAEELSRAAAGAKDRHRAALERLIRSSNIQGANEVHHVRGKADKVIPQFVDDEGIDILVMGTVARIGIPGFVIGNTAENIVRELPCSLLALKPSGFVSPVKAY